MPTILYMYRKVNTSIICRCILDLVFFLLLYSIPIRGNAALSNIQEPNPIFLLTHYNRNSLICCSNKTLQDLQINYVNQVIIDKCMAI